MFREKVNSAIGYRGKNVEKIIKNANTTVEFEVSFGTRFLGTVDHKNLFGLGTWKLLGGFNELIL